MTSPDLKYYCVVQQGDGSYPAYATNFFNVTCSHEMGHALGFQHNNGPWPQEFKTDIFDVTTPTKPPLQTGLMSTQSPTQNFWIRHEDWQQANYNALHNNQ